MTYSFEVPGRPVPQGSLRSFQAKSGGIVTPQQPKVLRWRADVRAGLYAAAGEVRPIEGPFSVSVGFWFKRPQAHLTSKGALKLSAPTHHTQSPDVDKLLRSVLDALTGVVWHDDKQVVDVQGHKFWHDRDFATILIKAL